MKNKETVVDIKSLVKNYKDFIALDNLNLQISKGEIFGFLEHNRAGKTITINIFTTLLTPPSGSATIGGFVISRDSLEVRKRK